MESQPLWLVLSGRVQGKVETLKRIKEIIMSQIFISAFVLLLSHGLPLIGIHWADSQVASFAQNVIDIALAAWIMFRRKQMGDINVAGVRK